MKVYIESPGRQYIRMFEENGWDVVDNVDEADLVQFTGGADVNPALYGEEKHPHTRSDLLRDEREQRLFTLCRKRGVPMAGICRGGQFLNVMCGGAMWQHIDRHAIYGTHPAKDLTTGRMVNVTSTHHQMMHPAPHARVLMVAEESTYTESMLQDTVARISVEEDIESVLYPRQKVLCYQPHPEHQPKGDPCQETYFKYLKEIV
jgi:gamma-glutamyl-gamma-aminobutyrate hydrolase PuuD